MIKCMCVYEFVDEMVRVVFVNCVINHVHGNFDKAIQEAAQG